MTTPFTSTPTFCGRSCEDYLAMVAAFHGHPAPGLVLGGLMVDLAYRRLPPSGLFDAVCETRHCLPDAVQLLTPCTVGNGWLQVMDLGRFALALYDKQTGRGVRVAVDHSRLGDWPAIRAFLFKTVPKREQDSAALQAEILSAGSSILSAREVLVEVARLRPGRHRAFALCPVCGEGYPADEGEVCRGCRGEAPYLSLAPSGSAEAEAPVAEQGQTREAGG